MIGAKPTSVVFHWSVELNRVIVVSVTSLIISTDRHIPTQSHQESTSDPSRMNLNETLRSMQQSIEKLARDVEDLKKDKSSATMEQRVGDNLGGLNSPHHQRFYENISNYGYHDMPVQNSHPFHESGHQGRPQVRGKRRVGLGERGYYRPHPRHEAWHDDNLYEDYGANSNVVQAYYGNQQGDKALDKIKRKASSFKRESDPNKLPYRNPAVADRLLPRKTLKSATYRTRFLLLIESRVLVLDLIDSKDFYIVFHWSVELQNPNQQDLDPNQHVKEDSYHVMSVSVILAEKHLRK
ncbi:hypothetical protein M9H77_30684 [Catharanthus roseus]|uniref:Uncharacterized protein n=1 Tax=Catharanthus roseus TaxID=4058 RepID=A0ACB9ZZ92_CATRO|nr:hypothetical protein M9H77_30684 [Catharanthus roseus]